MEIANYVDKVRPGVYMVGSMLSLQRSYRTGDPVAPELPSAGLAAPSPFRKGNEQGLEGPGWP